jgi:hypothetical protein
MHTEPIHPDAHMADLRPVPAPPVEYTRLRAAVATRLRRVCGEMAPEAFDALVDEICAMKVRWAQSEARRR